MSGVRARADALLPWAVGVAVAVLWVAAAWNGLGLHPFVVRPVGTSYWGGDAAPRLLAPGGDRLALLAALAACLVAVAAGLPLARRFTAPRAGPVERGLAVLAGFLPGYLAVVAVHRILTLLLPNRLALPAALAAWGLLAVLGVVAALRAGRGAERGALSHVEGEVGPARPRWLGSRGAAAAAATVAVVVAAFAVLQVQAGDAHVVGDGAAFFLELVRHAQWWRPEARFPVVTQHYDELMFLYPVVQLDAGRGGRAAIDGYWVLYAFGKAACFAALYLSAAALARSRALGLLAALLCFFGAIAPIPTREHLVFDSADPLWMTLHPARIVIAILPVVLLAIVPRLEERRRLGPAAWAVLALAGIGASALPLHVVAVLAFAAFAAAAARQAGGEREAARAVALALVGAIVMYAAPGKVEPAAVATLACAGALAPASWRAVRARATYRATLVAVAVVLGAAVAGALLLGNLPAGRVHARLGTPLAEIVSRPTVPVPMSLGRNRFCGTFPLFQCTSLATFAAYQGLPLVLAGLAVLLGLRRARRAEDGPPPDAALPRALAFSTVALVASLFVMDFLNGRSGPATWLQIWLKSRLVEPWFYGTLVVALAAVWSRAGTGGRRAVAAALVLFLVLRHALSPGGGIVGQLAANGAYLAAHLR